MSDRKNSNNTDNQNTRTTYIPPEAREQYRQAYQNQQPRQNPPKPQNHQQYQNPIQNQSPPQYQNPMQYHNPTQYQSPPQYPNPAQYQSPPQYQNHPYSNQSYPPQRPPQNNHRPKQSPKKKRKKKRKSFLSKFLGRLLGVVIIIFLLLFGIYSCTVMGMIKKINYSETGSRSRTNGALSANYVTSVLLIGTDGRNESEQGRSDTMILLSLNSKSKTVNLTSFMRDCYVEIPDYGWDKLNAAYSYGGAELLMDTIEHNFGIRIDDYVSVNFVSFANIIDSVGGIKIDVSDAEAQEINTILQAEVNSIMGDDTLSDLLSSGGKDILLNGKQALSYARIRYVGNADFERTERQRKVMELVMNKIKSFSPSSLSNISKSVMPNVSTNMPSMDMYTLSLRMPFLIGYETQQLQIPADNTYYGEYTASGDALIVDFDANYNIIKQNVFAE